MTVFPLPPPVDESRESLVTLQQRAGQLNKALDQHWSDIDRIRDAIPAGKEMTQSQKRDFDDVQARITRDGNERDKVVARLEELNSQAVAEVNHTLPGSAAPFLRRDESMRSWVRRNGVQPEHEGLRLSRYLRGLALGDWRGADAEQRAMGGLALGAGGHLLPTVLSAELIDLARNQARVLEAGARVVPMDARTVDVARWEADPTPAWRAELAAVATDDGAVGAVTLSAKSLAVIVRVSRELLEDSDPSVEQALQNAFAAKFALSLDFAALYGSGSSNQPTGIKTHTDVEKQSLATNGAPLDFDVLLDGVGALEDANETPSGVILAPRSERALAKLKDDANRYLDPPRKLDSVPRLATNQIPVDLTHGTAENASDVFVGDFSQLFVGVRTEFRIEVLSERYVDTGELGFLGWARADIAVARPAAFRVLTGVVPA